MKITSLKIALQDRDTRLVALATIVIDETFLINGIRVLSSPTGFFLGMPSYTKKDGTHQDIAHPLNPDARAALERLLIGAYNHCVSNQLPVSWFLVRDDFKGTLTEQNFSDFYIKDSCSKNKAEPKNTDAFKDWLYN